VSQPALAPPPEPNWNVRPSPKTSVVEALSGALNLPDILCRILAGRGQTSPDDARAFLRPELGHLHAPSQLVDAERGAGRIHEAIARGERILVHGDYDVDGIASAALLSSWIRRFGGNVSAFVPHRLRDGYDFGAGGLEAAREFGAGLIVTCDCGIRAIDAVAAAGAAGIDVVVTDHHTPGDRLPDAIAVINPNRRDCPYPNKGLAGAGVAFKLCQLMAAEYGIADKELWPTLDLVGLASVADLVPLVGENRTLVRYGLRALERTKRPGLRALMAETQVGSGALEAGRIGFILAPPINAAGRVGDAKRGLALLEAPTEAEGAAVASELVALNRERQTEDRRTVAEALDLLAPSYDDSRDFGVVVAGPRWHPGVIGIVASRLVERIFRPVVVIALDGEEGRGSARSIPQVDLFDAIERCGELLGRFGGHRQAAGLDIAATRIPEFTEAFNLAVREQLSALAPVPTVHVDAEVSLEELTPEVNGYLKYFGPFGMGNPRPVFSVKGVEQVGRAREVGSGHLKLFVKQGTQSFEAIGFGLATRISPQQLGTDRLDLAFQLKENEYQGRRSLQLQLKDVKPSAAA
jgi:single-stranded-DNA-specific exonuclease